MNYVVPVSCTQEARMPQDTTLTRGSYNSLFGELLGKKRLPQWKP